jgi:glycosidase
MMLLMQSITMAQGTPSASPVAGGGGAWWQGAACYEIFVRSFSDSDGDGIGDLQGLIGKLDYLNDGQPGEGDDLGVTCIWLMPIMQSPSYHGYDVTDYLTVEDDYGTNDDFLRLMDEAHARNIRVVIDFPINHTSSEHPWFTEAASDPDSGYRDWYIFEDEDAGYIGPWGQPVWHSSPAGGDFYYGIFDSGMPDLDYTNPEVNTEIERITEFWLTEMGVDGFRLDAVKHMIEDGEAQENTPQTITWLEEYSAFIRSVEPDAFTVGEVNGSGTDGLLPYYPDTLDEYFQFELAQTIVNSASFGSARQLGPILNGSVGRLPDGRWGTFLTNHDQKRIASQLGGDFDKLRVAGMLLLSLPGTPFMYYGEEIGMPGDKPDPRLRTPMQWAGDSGGGFTSGTPWAAMQPGWEELNVAAQGDDLGSVLATYRAWGQLREMHPALQTGDYIPIESGNQGMLAFVRQAEEETVLVFINLGSNPTEALAMTAPEGISGRTTDLFTGEASIAIGSDGTFTLPPMDGRSGTVVQIED